MYILRRDQVTSRRLGDETVLLNLSTSTYLTLNEPATLLAELLRSGADRAQLVDALLAEYDVTAERAAADVAALLDDLARHQLLDRVA